MSLQQIRGASRGECRDTKLVELIDEPSEMVCLNIIIIRMTWTHVNAIVMVDTVHNPAS